MNDTPALRTLIDQHGVEKVYHAGIEVLQWPPWWWAEGPSVFEVLKIQEVLSQ